jgi:uncharacterized DUF497 family protein
MGVHVGVHYFMQFSWDENKRAANLKKHGIDFIDAEELFDGSLFTHILRRGRTKPVL